MQISAGVTDLLFIMTYIMEMGEFSGLPSLLPTQ